MSSNRTNRNGFLELTAAAVFGLVALAASVVGILVGNVAVKQRTTAFPQARTAGNIIGNVNHGAVLTQQQAEQRVLREFGPNFGVRLIQATADITTEGQGTVKKGNDIWQVFNKQTGEVVALVQPDCWNEGMPGSISFTCNGFTLDVASPPRGLGYAVAGYVNFLNPDTDAQLISTIYLNVHLGNQEKSGSWPSNIYTALRNYPSVKIYMGDFRLTNDEGTIAGFSGPFENTVSCGTVSIPTPTLSPTPTTTHAPTPTPTPVCGDCGESCCLVSPVCRTGTGLACQASTLLCVNPNCSWNTTDCICAGTPTPTSTGVPRPPTPTLTPTPTPTATGTPVPTVTPTPAVTCNSLSVSSNKITPGQQVTIAANVSATLGIKRVEFYYSFMPGGGGVDLCAGSSWTLIGQDSSSPYSVTWNTSGLTAGYYHIAANVYDTANNWCTGNPIGTCGYATSICPLCHEIVEIIATPTATPPTTGQPPQVIQLDWLKGTSGVCWTAWVDDTAGGTCTADDLTYGADIGDGLRCNGNSHVVTISNPSTNTNSVDLAAAGYNWEKDVCNYCAKEGSHAKCTIKNASGGASGTLRPGCSITLTTSGAGSISCPPAGATATPVPTATPRPGATATPTLTQGCYCPGSCSGGGCWWGSSGPNRCPDSACPAPTATPMPALCTSPFSCEHIADCPVGQRLGYRSNCAQGETCCGPCLSVNSDCAQNPQNCCQGLSCLPGDPTYGGYYCQTPVAIPPTATPAPGGACIPLGSTGCLGYGMHCCSGYGCSTPPESGTCRCGSTCPYSEGGNCHSGNCLDANQPCSLNVNCGYVSGCSSGAIVPCTTALRFNTDLNGDKITNSLDWSIFLGGWRSGRYNALDASSFLYTWARQ